VTQYGYHHDHPNFGREFDWLAHDLDGAVGLLMTGGYGPVPQSAYAHAKELDDVDMEDLPVICGFRLEMQVPITTSYEQPAQRGLYSYDWDLGEDLYHRASVPEHPLAVGDMSPEVSLLARLVQLPVTFASCRVLDLFDIGIRLALPSDPGVP
jgi:hypothetical protein